MKTLRLALFTLITSLVGPQMSWSMEWSKFSLWKPSETEKAQEQLENLLYDLQTEKQKIVKQTELAGKQLQQQAALRQIRAQQEKVEQALNRITNGEPTEEDLRLLDQLEKQQLEKEKASRFSLPSFSLWGRPTQEEEEEEPVRQRPTQRTTTSSLRTTNPLRAALWRTQPEEEELTEREKEERAMNKEIAEWERDLAARKDLSDEEKSKMLARRLGYAEVKGGIQSTAKQIREAHALATGVMEDVGAAAKATKAFYTAVHKKFHGAGPGFEISNKSDEPIWVAIGVGKKLMPSTTGKGYHYLTPGQRKPLKIDLKLPVTIGIFTQKPATTSKITQNNFFPLHHQFVSTDRKQPTMTFVTDDSAMGKTKYFTWNPGHGAQPLYPQTGEWGGLRKLTSSGFSLLNNIKPYEISQVETEGEEGEEEED